MTTHQDSTFDLLIEGHLMAVNIECPKAAILPLDAAATPATMTHWASHQSPVPVFALKALSLQRRWQQTR